MPSVFGEFERDLALVLDQLIGARTHEQLDALDVAVVCRKDERRRAVRVDHVEQRARLEKQLDTLDRAVEARTVQGSRRVEMLRLVNCRCGLDQQMGAATPAILTCDD